MSDIKNTSIGKITKQAEKIRDVADTGKEIARKLKLQNQYQISAAYNKQRREYLTLLNTRQYEYHVHGRGSRDVEYALVALPEMKEHYSYGEFSAKDIVHIEEDALEDMILLETKLQLSMKRHMRKRYCTGLKVENQFGEHYARLLCYQLRGTKRRQYNIYSISRLDGKCWYGIDPATLLRHMKLVILEKDEASQQV